MAISFNGEISSKDLGRALAVAIRPSRTAMVWRTFMAAVLLLVAILSPIVLGVDGWLPVPFVLLWGLLLVYPWWSPYTSARMQWNSNKTFHAPKSGEVDDTGVHLVTCQSDARIAWPAYVQYKLGRDVLLLYSSVLVMDPFIRSQFASDADWQAFVGLVQAHVPEASKAKLANGVQKWTRWVFVGFLVLVAVIAFLVNFLTPSS